MTLAQGWDGTSWKVQSTPNAADGTFSNDLSAVSCSGPDRCTAVGDWSGDGRGGVLIERWNGVAWMTQAATVPGGTTAQLTGVSCPSSESCVAIGDDSSSSYAIVWEGAGWTEQSTPSLGGGQSSNLRAISCGGSTGCTAVGERVFGTGLVQPLAERSGGSQWAVQAAVGLPGAQATAITATSCVQATACQAVGNFVDASNGQTLALAEGWSGSGWTIEAMPDPATATSTYITGVSCPSLNACLAVGYSTERNFDTIAIAELWDGEHWTISSVPPPSSATYATFSAIACDGTNSCTAVGDDNVAANATFAEHWNGSTWTPQSTASPPGPNAKLDGISCPTISTCTAVGSYENASTFQLQPLAEAWDGHRLADPEHPDTSRRNVRQLPHVGLVQLSAISCTAPTACTAVGSGSRVVTIPIAEHYS